MSDNVCFRCKIFSRTADAREGGAAVTEVLAFFLALVAYRARCLWLSRRRPRRGLLGWLERVRACMAYEGDPVTDNRPTEQELRLAVDQVEREEAMRDE